MAAGATASAVVANGFMSSTAHTIVTNHPVTRARGCDRRDDVEADVGRFAVWYSDHCHPVSPLDYAGLLDRAQVNDEPS